MNALKITLGCLAIAVALRLAFELAQVLIHLIG
jgi:hypothetical protein